MDVAAWLSDLGLGQYEEAFRANDIDAEVLTRPHGRGPDRAWRRLDRPPPQATRCGCRPASRLGAGHRPFHRRPERGLRNRAATPGS